jgi:hypothetical protein
MAAALQKKNLTALTTLPGKHAELRVNTFLQETLTGDTCQFDFSAVGTSLLSLAHPFPQRQTTALDDLTISRWVASRVQFRKAFPRASAMPNQGLHSRFGKSEDLWLEITSINKDLQEKLGRHADFINGGMRVRPAFRRMMWVERLTQDPDRLTYAALHLKDLHW